MKAIHVALVDLEMGGGRPRYLALTLEASNVAGILELPGGETIVLLKVCADERYRTLQVKQSRVELVTQLGWEY